MRTPAILWCLPFLLITSSCRKSTPSGGLTGAWKLVSRTPAVLFSQNNDNEMIAFRLDHTFQVKRNDTLISAGPYSVGQIGTPPRSIVYFTVNDPSYGSFVSFEKDTLVLTYAGFIPALYTIPVSKYVRK